MTLGQQIKQLRGSTPQKNVASHFCETFGHLAGKDWSLDTVISHLSRLENDKLEGIRFFFADLEHAHALLKILRVSDGEKRQALIEQAELLLREQPERLSRLVVDLTAFDCAGEAAVALFEVFDKTFLAQQWQRLRPISLLVTKRQYDRLPRSFDDLDDDLRTYREPFPSVPSSALLCSGSVSAPFERWLAIDYHNGSLTLDPPDGLQQFLSKGQLDPLPAVEAPLPPASPTAEAPSLPRAATERRRLMAQLSSADEAAKLRLAPEQRAQLAEALGIQGTLTLRERISMEIDGIATHLALTPEPVNQQELPACLARAARRPGPPRMLRVGDDIHLINCSTIPPHELVAVTPHTFAEPPPSILSLVLRELDSWTLDDIYQDPYLYELQTKLALETGQPELVAHVCDTISLAKAYPDWVKPGPVEDWLGELRTLLARRMPAPGCFVDRDKLPSKNSYDDAARYALGKPIQDGVPRHRLAFPQSVVQAGELPHSECVLQGRSHHAVSPMDLPYNLYRPRDEEAWLDLLDAMERAREKRQPNHLYESSWPTGATMAHVERNEGPAIDAREVMLLALDAWESLRDAASVGRASALPDGRFALRINPSVSALITSRQRRSGCAPCTLIAMKAQISCRNQHGYHLSAQLQKRLNLLEVGGYRGGPLVPEGVYLSNERAAFEIEFVGTPLLGSGLLSAASAASLGAAAMAEAEEAARRAREDDDD